MKLVIEEFWQKVIEDSTQPFGTRVLPDYERKSIVSYPNGGGWNDRNEWRKSMRDKKGFLGFDQAGRAKFDRGTWYGIHGYQLVSLEA